MITTYLDDLCKMQDNLNANDDYYNGASILDCILEDLKSREFSKRLNDVNRNVSESVGVAMIGTGLVCADIFSKLSMENRMIVLMPVLVGILGKCLQKLERDS